MDWTKNTSCGLDLLLVFRRCVPHLTIQPSNLLIETFQLQLHFLHLDLHPGSHPPWIDAGVHHRDHVPQLFQQARLLSVKDRIGQKEPFLCKKNSSTVLHIFTVKSGLRSGESSWGGLHLQSCSWLFFGAGTSNRLADSNNKAICSSFSWICRWKSSRNWYGSLLS